MRRAAVGRRRRARRLVSRASPATAARLSAAARRAGRAVLAGPCATPGDRRRREGRGRPRRGRSACSAWRFAQAEARCRGPRRRASRRRCRRPPWRRWPASTRPASRPSWSWSLAGAEPRLRAAAAEVALRPAGLDRCLPRRGREGQGRPRRRGPGPAQLLRHYPDDGVRARAAQALRRRLARRAGRGRRLPQGAAAQGGPRPRQGGLQEALLAVPQLEGVGQHVGADLSAIRDRGREAVLLNILDPNREVSRSSSATSW